MPQDEFDDMCKRWLEATKDQVEGLTDEQKKEMNPAFIGYEFESDHRPWHVTKQMKVPDNIPKPEYHETGDPVSERAIKANRTSTIPINTPEDMDKMREVCAIGREVLDITSRFLKAGVTADELDRVCFMACMERGGYPSPLNYNKFPKSLCVSVNEVICHGIPDCRPVQEGDIVNLDVSCYVNGYHGDTSRTFQVGEVSSAARKLCEVTEASLTDSIALCGPGTALNAIGKLVSARAEEHGYEVNQTFVGHGICSTFHARPFVFSHYVPEETFRFPVGLVFTIEPILCEGRQDFTIWDDGWTIVSADGGLSAQYEHTVLITEHGAEVLT
mmetsp:Transcript_3508/g.10796  ORF Transcript_3508/g.10796 Transcript_3508/m.10796 type:complete len:330 (+) Transcript_3508:231-1220(+)